MEEKIFCLIKKGSAYRKRYDSSMCFEQYCQTYGAIPKAPILKPLKDLADDIPEFKLEDSSVEEEDEENEKSSQKNKKRGQKMETIPEIDNSENNSIGFKSSNKKMDFFLEVSPLKNKQDQEEDIWEGDEINPKYLGRRRRAQSETQDYSIYSFLLNNSKGKKKVKKS